MRIFCQLDFSFRDMLTIIRVVLLCLAAQQTLAGIRISEERLRIFRERVSKLKIDLDDNKVSAKVARVVESIPSSTRKGSSSLQFYACNACQAMIDEFMYVRRVELFNDTDLVEMAIDVCSVFEFESEAICDGVINLYAPTVIYIIDNRPDLSADTVCKVLLNDGDCGNPHNDDILEFTVTIDEEETPQAFHAVDDDEEQQLSIIHLTDIHLDLKYKEGTQADCDNFACCRDVVKANKSSLHSAGYWGSYNHCDTPLRAVEDAFRQIVRQHPVSIIHSSEQIAIVCVISCRKLMPFTSRGTLWIITSTIHQSMA
jgi:hypothetical protein